MRSKIAPTSSLLAAEYPVARYFGNEILSHNETKAADLSRLNDARSAAVQPQP
jgi:hypothetical protein